jgi:glucose/arabinose dehydrogenase
LWPRLQRWRHALAALALGLAATSWPSAATSATPAQPQPQVLAQGLEHPWALAFIGPEQVLVSERAGRLRVVGFDGRVSPPLQGLPDIDEGGQGGLLDLITDRAFERNRIIYFCYSEPARAGGGNSTALASARLSADLRRIEQLRVLFRQSPKVGSRHHFGCRIVEAPDGHLFLTLGDRFSRMDDAQTLDNHHGKVVRVAKDGSVPPDNPLLGRPGALPEIWSWGHRNPQGAAWGPDGMLWIHEHGPRGGDELNRVLPGRNYGWPVITHGVNYIGTRIGAGITEHPGMEQPLVHWTPSIAPSGMAFLLSPRYGPQWQGNLFVGALRGQHLLRLQLDGTRVVAQQRLLEDLGQRIRDVRQGPDGLLYLLTDERNGQLIRLLPP